MAVVAVSRGVLLIGVVIILVSAFGVSFGSISAFQVGVGLAFASFLVP